MDSVSRSVAAQIAAAQVVVEHAIADTQHDNNFDASYLLIQVAKQLRAVHEMLTYDALEEEEAVHAQIRMHDYEQHAQALNPPPPF